MFNSKTKGREKPIYARSEKLTVCPACLNKDVMLKYTTADEVHHTINLLFDMFFCRACETYLPNPIPDQSLIHTFYGR